ncbi:hypothetical protein BS78_02G343600 [Paspalum vaginatum]|nr:hypothetical protein BS78_02G343600 [Paspalum vaginatum]
MARPSVNAGRPPTRRPSLRRRAQFFPWALVPHRIWSIQSPNFAQHLDSVLGFRLQFLAALRSCSLVLGSCLSEADHGTTVQVLAAFVHRRSPAAVAALDSLLHSAIQNSRSRTHTKLEWRRQAWWWRGEKGGADGGGGGTVEVVRAEEGGREMDRRIRWRGEEGKTVSSSSIILQKWVEMSENGENGILECCGTLRMVKERSSFMRCQISPTPSPPSHSPTLCGTLAPSTPPSTSGGRSLDAVEVVPHPQR